MIKNKLAKDYIWNTLGSGLASVTSLIFMIIATRINGTDISGIFSICFATSCIIYTIALYSGRIYQVTDNDKSIEDMDYIYHRLISTILAIIFTVIFGLVRHYNGIKFIILLLLSFVKILEAINDVFHGILQKNNKLEIVGKSLLIRSILNILSFLVVDILTKNIVLACLSLIIDNLIVLMFIDIKNSKKLFENKLQFNSKNIKKIFSLGFYTFSIQFICNYLYNIPRYVIDGNLSDELQAIYGIIIMPATIIMVVNQFIIHPVIVRLKECFESNKKQKFLSYVIKIILATFMVGIISAIAAYFVGIPILELMYNLELKQYLYDLLIIIFGATMYTIVSVFSNSLIVLRKTKIQFYIYTIVTIISYFVSKHLVNLYAFNGAIYSYLFMMGFLLILYYIVYKFYISKVWGDKNKKNK